MSEPQIGRHRLLKDLNHKAVLELLASQGSLSRVDISERLTLSQASVSRIVESLSGAGLVREEGSVAARLGRPQVLVGIDPAAARVASVSLRPRKLRARLADLLGGVLAETELRTGPDDSAAASAEQVAEVVAGLMADHGGTAELVAMTVGVAAAWDATAGRVYAARTQQHLEGVDLVTLLEQRLRAHRQRQESFEVAVEVDNDVNLAAIGEAASGVVAGEEDYFYLSLGSGVGGAVVAGGKLYRGVQGFAGEIGYLPRRDDVGASHDLEERVSIDALEAALRAAGSEPDAYGFVARQPLGVAEDKISQGFVDDVAFAIVAVTATLNPRLVVLGGSLGSCCGPLLPRIEAALANRLPVSPKVVVSRLGRDVALIGGLAGALANARSVLLRSRLD